MYSHRNGETEPPTEAGRPSEFWFRGTGKYVMQDWQSDDISIAGKVFVSHVESDFLVYGQSVTGHHFSFRASDMAGQWWGPVTPPWEAQPPTRNYVAAFESLREVVGDAFDKIDDVNAWVSEVRGGDEQPPAQPTMPSDVREAIYGSLEFERIKTLEMAEMWREGSNQWKRHMAEVDAIDTARAWLDAHAQEGTK